MPSHVPAKEQAAADDVEVYANGVAFDVVKGWLGSAGKDLEFDQWFGVEDVDADRPARQERLGLGAKFLSHDKAARLTGGVHKKLGKALARSQRRREEEEEEDERRVGTVAGCSILERAKANVNVQRHCVALQTVGGSVRRGGLLSRSSLTAPPRSRRARSRDRTPCDTAR